MAVARRFAPGVVVLAATTVSIVLALAGLSVLPLVATAAFAWFLVIASRWGAGMGITTSVLGSGLLLLVELILSGLIATPILIGSVVVWTLASLAAVPPLMRAHNGGRARALGGSALIWLPPLLGPLVWIAFIILSSQLPSASHFSWVMMGDSANNMLFARGITYVGGIRLGPDENPVPLPAGLIALAMSAGRSGTSAAGFLRHDLTSFVGMWASVVALLAYVTGAAAAITVNRSRKLMVAVLGAGVSLIPLSWFVTGYPVEYGFFNAHIALLIVFASWIAFHSGSRSPVLALSLLLAGCTLMLAVWSPLVLVPLALAVVLVVRQRSYLFDLRGRRLVLLIVAVAQLAIFAIVGTLPGLLAQGGFLSSVGGVIPFPRTILFVAIGVSVAVAVFAIRRRETNSGIALVAVVAAGGIGIGVLLFLSRNQPSPWTYYPTKLAWLMTIVFGVLALGTLIGALPKLRPAISVAIVAALSLFSFGAIEYAARSVPTFTGHDPIPRILADDFPVTNQVAESIVTLSDPDHPHLLWKSNDPFEGSINFWLLEMRADSVKDNFDLRVFAYGHGDSVTDLCDIVTAMGGKVTVLTADPTLSSSVDGACAGSMSIQPYVTQ